MLSDDCRSLFVHLVCVCACACLHFSVSVCSMSGADTVSSSEPVSPIDGVGNEATKEKGCEL